MPTTDTLLPHVAIMLLGSMAPLFMTLLLNAWFNYRMRNK